MDSSAQFDECALDINVDSLVRALADETAVIFVGAGASVAAGLPSWHDFLKDCLQRAKKYDDAAVKWKHIESLLEAKQFLRAAELLQWTLKNDLHQYIWDAFGKNHLRPSDVHLAIARMPFTVAVTTNYDSLLEAACTAMSRPLIHSCTWQRPDDIYQALREKDRFTLVKSHGTATQRDSLILTHTQYRDLQSRNRSYNDLIAHLFCFRTCLFVGHSLQDSDILEQLSKVREIHGDAIGPHYAILFEGEKSQYELDLLETAFAIQPILIRKKEVDQKKTDDDSATENVWKTTAVVRVLKHLHGQVAKCLRNRGFSESTEPSPFNRRDASLHLLKNVLYLTGAFRGDICLIDDLDRPQLRIVASHTRDKISRNAEENDLRARTEHVSPKSIIGRTFYRSTSDRDVTYVRDVTAAAFDLDQSRIPDAEYVTGHPDVRSELAVPILFAGTVVGVLNIESTIRDAFNNEHLEVVRWGAQEAGRIWNRANLRYELTRKLDPCYKQVKAFGELIDLSRKVRDLDLRYILYEIDHFHGKAIPHLANPDPEQKLGSFDFDERSLTNYVLTKEQRKFVRDVDADIEDQDNGVCSARGAKELGFHGPAFGVALQKDGRPTAVLTCYSRRMSELWKKWKPEFGPSSTWETQAEGSNEKKPSDKKAESRFQKTKEIQDQWARLTEHFEDATLRIERLAQLITNDASLDHGGDLLKTDAGKAIESLNVWLKKVDREKQWTSQQLRDANFQRRIMRVVCECLLESCGFRRIRLWWIPKVSSEKIGLVCIWSLTDKDSRFGRKPRANAYRGVAAHIGSPYYDLVHAMSASPPAARYHNVSMFDAPDENFELLDKKKNGSWMVVPILGSTKKDSPRARVVGCLSGDMQYPMANGEIADDWDKEPQRHAFQRYALELAADVLSPLVRLYRLDPEEIPHLRTVRGVFPTEPKAS